MLQFEIDLKTLRSNLVYIKDKLQGRELCAVVKAEAYGHGFEIARYISPYCTSFAVANGEEALKLRKYTDKKIYILGGFDEDSYIDDCGFIYTVASFRQIEMAARCNVAGVTLKVNTGMNRLGFSINEVDEALKKIAMYGLKLDSVYTHLFDPPLSATQQIDVFNRLNIPDVKRHCCASNFLQLHGEGLFDLVRCGLAIYGYGDIGVRPIAKVFAKIVGIQRVKKGEYIGYGRNAAESDMTIAIVNAGYADGINRLNSGKNIEIAGHLCPIVGNICMDMCMVNITGYNFSEGDRAYFLSDKINAQDIADRTGSIVYEILTSFRGRLKRKYI